MKLKFKHQQFQADAAKAVCDVFIGQPCQSGMRYLVAPGKSRKSAAPLMDMHGYRNAPLADHMDGDKLRNNLHAVQDRNLLKQSESDVGKRQEVGRGMRLCVNQDGERMDYNRLGNDIHRINTLTVIASESYKDFAGGLQRAIADDVPNRPRKVTAKLFENKKLVSNTGADKLDVDSNLAAKLFISLAKNDYIDDDGKLTAKYEQDYNNAAVKLPEAVADYSQAVLDILRSVYSGEYAGIENDRDKNTEVRLDEDKINRQEFKALWKQIYFVAETKGSMNSMQLRLIEDTKIKCARKHFAAISSDHVVYDVIDSYKSLVEKVMK